MTCSLFLSPFVDWTVIVIPDGPGAVCAGIVDITNSGKLRNNKTLKAPRMVSALLQLRAALRITNLFSATVYVK
jgi:hypothetical protein